MIILHFLLIAIGCNDFLETSASKQLYTMAKRPLYDEVASFFLPFARYVPNVDVAKRSMTV